MSVNVIRIAPADNVGVATEEIAAGTKLRMTPPVDLTARDDVPYGNKVALVHIRAGTPIVKYGEEIGTATVDIAAGDKVHTHNVTPLPIPDVYVEIT